MCPTLRHFTKLGKNYPCLMAGADVTQHVSPAPSLPSAGLPVPGHPQEGCSRCSPFGDAAPFPSALLPARPLGPSSLFPGSPGCSPLAKASLGAGQSGFLAMSSNSPRRLCRAAHPEAAPAPACPSPAARTVPVAAMGQVARPTLPGPKGVAPQGSLEHLHEVKQGSAGAFREGCRPLGAGPSCGGEGPHVSGAECLSPHERKA